MMYECACYIAMWGGVWSGWMNKTIYRREIILPSVELQGEKKQTYAMLVKGKNMEEGHKITLEEKA